MIETTASKRFEQERELARPQARAISPLVWLNLLCLDAPLVAVSWQWLFARMFSIAVPPGEVAGLFLTAWLIYLADRFVDNLSLGEGGSASLRQRFSLRHRRLWLGAIGMIALVDLVVILAALDFRALLAGGSVGLFAITYLAINQFRPSLWRFLPLKEITIGIIFAAGTMVGLWPGLTTAAWPAWVCFAALCGLNCICIAVWECALDATQARVSIATAFPLVGNCVQPALLLLGLTSAYFAFAQPATRPLWLCECGSATALWVLTAFGGRLEPNLRTALADLALLTPLGALLFR